MTLNVSDIGACVATSGVIVAGAVGLGTIKAALLRSLQDCIEGYRTELQEAKRQIAELKNQIEHLAADLAKKDREDKLKTVQLTLTTRIIEYFERVLTVYVRNRHRIPADVVSQIEARLRDLAEFRKRASLDLADQEINEQFYTDLMARVAIGGVSTSIDDSAQDDIP